VGAIYHQGLLLAAQQRYREALASFRRVGEVDPNSEYARRAFREARVAQRHLEADAEPITEPTTDPDTGAEGTD
jgi:tetratricopeptide (TPR) repeat protein